MAQGLAMLAQGNAMAQGLLGQTVWLTRWRHVYGFRTKVHTGGVLVMGRTHTAEFVSGVAALGMPPSVLVAAAAGPPLGLIIGGVPEPLRGSSLHLNVLQDRRLAREPSRSAAQYRPPTSSVPKHRQLLGSLAFLILRWSLSVNCHVWCCCLMPAVTSFDVNVQLHYCIYPIL
jgi:hypothetical protein